MTQTIAPEKGIHYGRKCRGKAATARPWPAVSGGPKRQSDGQAARHTQSRYARRRDIARRRGRRSDAQGCRNSACGRHHRATLVSRSNPAPTQRPAGDARSAFGDGRGKGANCADPPAASEGEITPDEAGALTTIIEAQRRAIETVELEARLRAVEERNFSA
jgi:hypothetical protein